MRTKRISVLMLVAISCLGTAFPATVLSHYFAHDAVEDRYGVIAPWYQGQNGQFDLRVRIAAETLKRYPWTSSNTAVAIVPQYILNGTWHITPDGEITIPALSDWANGDEGQMAAREIEAFISYYRYSGDPSALGQVSLIANTILDHCTTSADSPWPNFLISVPVTGRPYGNCDAKGWIQLDIAGETALALIHAYEATGEKRWLNAAEHWADVLVEKRNHAPGQPPWGRYANPQDVKWGMEQSGNVQAGGILYELMFFDELIRLGYTGTNHSLIETRDAARAYLRDVLLPNWTVNETWGRNYWDWPDPVQAQTTTDWASRYLLANKSYFQNWKNDVRNILSLYFNHTTVNPKSAGEVYSGAWALPESSSCCGSSLAWAPVELAADFAQYAHDTGDEWARELARRQLIFGTYDLHPNGVAEDNIFGGTIAAGGWFITAHPSMLEWTLRAMSWLPELTGPGRENHIMRSTSVVNHVEFKSGNLSYTTFDAPSGTADVMRLAYRPQSVSAAGRALQLRPDLQYSGYTVSALKNGDYLVEVRHDGFTQVSVQGPDPARVVGSDQLDFAGEWRASSSGEPQPHAKHTSVEGAAVTFSFVGNQVRLMGDVGPEGGLADVFLDDVKQLVGVDFWNPRNLHHQVVYYTSGLTSDHHVLKVVSSGAGNPISRGRQISIDGAEYSAATGATSFGEGGGPTDTQRLIFGYTGRSDYVDCEGHAWRPGMEFVARTGARTDSVAKTWLTMKQAVFIANTPEAELYQYGVHWPDFVVNVTVGPGTYHVRIHLAETQFTAVQQRSMTISVNDEPKAVGMDVYATAGGPNKALQLVYNAVTPKNGLISIRFKGNPVAGYRSEAIVQAIEVGPGPGGTGPTPVTQ